MASVIEMPELANYLPVMISSLYRSVQDVTNVDNEKVKTLAQEVLDLLQKRAGVKAFLEVYNSVHKHVQEVRKERHNKKVVQVNKKKIFFFFQRLFIKTYIEIMNFV